MDLLAKKPKKLKVWGPIIYIFLIRGLIWHKPKDSMTRLIITSTIDPKSKPKTQ